MTEGLYALIGAIIGALIGALSSIITTKVSNKYQLNNAIRSKREEIYKQLINNVTSLHLFKNKIINYTSEFTTELILYANSKITDLYFDIINLLNNNKTNSQELNEKIRNFSKMIKKELNIEKKTHKNKK